MTHLRASFTTSVEQRPWLRSGTAFLVTLRPAWWLVRGYLAAWVVWGIFGINHGIRPQGFSGYALALMAIVVSVQLGRGWLRQWALMRPLIVIGNAAAIIVAVLVWPLGAGSYPDDNIAFSVPGGLSLDGQQMGYQLWAPPLSILPLAPTAAPTSTPTATATKPVPTSSVSATPSGGPSPSVTRSGR